ncbi:MAG: DNA repair protein RecN [Deltaproteobacteria bacterium]|nr:MAG: DNA repair protein RecN [Deltaproteobacteria bacterium]
MIRELRISDLATIEELSISFAPGLNILSGETGAGKSVMMSALSLLLGDRADTQMIRTGANEATIEASFDETDTPGLSGHLEGMGIVCEESLVLKRVVSRTGRSRAYVNGSLVTLNMLRSLRPYLIDIHGQHEHQSLLDEATHVEILDTYGDLRDLRRDLTRALSALTKVRKELAHHRELERSAAEKEDFLRFQFHEIEAAHLEAGEEERIEEEIRILRNAEKLYEIGRRAEARLYGADDAVVAMLVGVLRDLEVGARIDPFFEPLTKTLTSARFEIEEVARTIQEYCVRRHFDPNRLEELQERLATIRRLKRKYGNSISEILARKEAIARELAAIENREEEIERCVSEVEALEGEVFEICQKLSLKRKETALLLDRQVMRELASLGMERCTFHVVQIPQYAEGDPEAVRNLRVSPRGGEQVAFHISPNPGQELRPLARIASGGELSRIMLAIRTVLSREGGARTLIFDEVDTGIGGAVAEVVGRKLQALGRHYQILCITHLPQIAALADAHYRVVKRVVGERTHTSIFRLDEASRIEEIARMLGGVKITPLTRKHARELIERGKRGEGVEEKH